MTTPIEYAHANGATFRQQLHDLIRIPSVSTDSQYAGDVRRAAEWLAAELKRIGMENVAVMPTAGHPVVYADWLHAGADKPTVLIYGHYDVQPADKVKDNWTSEPFEPIERDGFIYARGSSDDKGQAYIHVKAAEAYLKTEGKLPVNVKFILEGEEEIGSKNLQDFLKTYAAMLKADVAVISDTGMTSADQPEITRSLRGLTYMELNVTASSKDLHSGGYGGAIPNPALILAQMVAKLHNPDNSIAVPGFYDKVRPLTDADRSEIAKLALPDSEYLNITGAPGMWGEAAYTADERIVARPTLEINGLLSGWTGEGAKTVLPCKAMAKISCRLVADQDPVEIYELVKAYIAQIAPPNVHAELKLINAGDPASIDPTLPVMQAAVRAYERGWGKAPLYSRTGGSIPVVADFKRILNVNTVMLGFGLNTDGTHGPDEHYSIDMFHKGIDTAIYYLEEVAK
ncbi:MAG: dipeptidase [Chloroflexi bacterium]|uniref:dipeptidase n=1 Tax=Candidatus Flexifilum breve TaxID=3140694 RepID=UPI0031367BFF|nr:dipeptidase [Chloroflexota bacterium]